MNNIVKINILSKEIMTDQVEIDPENYANWFALYYLTQLLGNQRSIQISSTDLGDILGVSQQTASRRIQSLEEMGWIRRKTDSKIQEIWITEQGADMMLDMYKSLKNLLEKVLIIGEVVEGMGEGGYYVAIKNYYEQFKDKLGFDPYKGTLNLTLSDMNITLLRENLKNRAPVIIEGFEDQDRRYGAVHCYDCYISLLDDRENSLQAAILDIKRTHHKKNVIEILAEPYLREHFSLKDGDKLIINLPPTEGC